MTEKVFYQDSYQKALTSEVVEVIDGGLLLAATIFYHGALVIHNVNQ